MTLDRTALARLRRFGGDALLTQMIDLFTTTGRERLDAAHNAALSADCSGVKRAFHALKSSAGQMGAVELQATCQQGEALSSQGVAAELPRLVGMAYEQFIVVVRLLQFERPAPTAPATAN